LINNINILESLPSASPFAHFLHKPLRVVSSNTRDFYLFKYSPPVHLLVQVILSRPVEALTHRALPSMWGSNALIVVVETLGHIREFEAGGALDGDKCTVYG